MNGGSGGYIYINTTNKRNDNYISNDARIEARGGFGKNKGLGGSGGVIVGGKNFRHIFNSIADGGLGGSYYDNSIFANCANAAAGTQYFWSLDLMIIDNKNHLSDKYT